MVVSQPNTRSNINVVKPPTFSGEARKILDFLMACRLFIGIKMRNDIVKE